MDGFLVSGEIVPEYGSVLEVGLRASLLGVDEEREFCGITEEEDGTVIVHPIPVALLSVELDGETMGITSGVGGALLASHSRVEKRAIHWVFLPMQLSMSIKVSLLS
jgi:hypothetical protein